MGNDKSLTELIQELADNSSLTDKKLNEYKERFKKIYTDNYRHEYSEITRVLFSIESEEARDFLTEKIKDIKDEIQEDDIKARITKLWDHVNLENIRMREMNKLAKMATSNHSTLLKEYDELKGKIKDIKEETRNAKEEVKMISKNIEDSTTKSITILGIFSGIVMAFSGGLSFVASAMQNINAISVHRLLFVVILLASAIFNIIFMLIYTIGKITGTYIGSKCNCDNPFEGCKEKTNQCGAIRYPVVTWFNIITLLALLVICVYYVIDKYNLLTIVIGMNPFVAITILVVVFISFLLLLIYMLNRLLKVECKYEYNDNHFSKFTGIFGSKYTKKK